MTTMKNQRKPNWDDPSMQVLCDGVERRLATIKGKFSPSLTQEKKQSAWATVTACVNAVTFGCTRTVDEVKKRWQDAQSSVKKKEAQRLKVASATGGGPAPNINFKCWEKIVLRTMSPTSISGLEGGVDTAETQIFESSILSEQGSCAPPHENDNDVPLPVSQISNGEACVPVIDDIIEDPNKKKTGQMEIATCSVSCQGDNTSAEEEIVTCASSSKKKSDKKTVAGVKSKRKSDVDLPYELLQLKIRKLKQEEKFQNELLVIERKKATTLNEIKEILVTVRDNLKQNQMSPFSRSPFSISPIIKFD